MNKQQLWRCVGLLSLLWSLLLPLFTSDGGVTKAQAATSVSGNTVTLDTVTVMAGNSGAFSLLLDNSDAVASGQFRFTYDTALGVTITGVPRDKASVTTIPKPSEIAGKISTSALSKACKISSLRRTPGRR